MKGNVEKQRRYIKSFSDKYNKNVSHAIVKYLRPELNKLPENKAEVEEMSPNFFEYHGFPQCIRAIDGTHIEIKEPKEHQSGFVNRKGYTSIHMQAVCD